MHVPRDLLDQKLNAMKLVLPGLFADSLPEHRSAGFEKIVQNLLRQCQAQDRGYALAVLAEIRQRIGLPVF